MGGWSGCLWYGGANYPLKLLLEGPDGFYVGGWGEPVLVAGFSSETYQDILLYGITATGARPDDWLVGGWGRGVTDSLIYLLFYNSTGLVQAVPTTDSAAFVANGGHFSTTANFATDTHYWATSAASSSGSSSLSTHGYVLPTAFAGQRLTPIFNTLRRGVIPNPDLTYALFVGNRSDDITAFPNGNPWLATAGGTFTRLSTDLNAAIPRSDLIGLTLYDKGVDAYTEGVWWPAAGQHSLTVTPWEITTGGACTEGTPFSVAYQAPDPAQYFAWDASLWVAPTP